MTEVNVSKVERNRRHLYSERCKDAILEIDPSAGHQFILAHLSDAEGKLEIPPYYWIFSGRCILALDPPRGVVGIPNKKASN